MKRNYPLLLASQSLGAFGDQFVLAVIIGQFTFLKKAGTISAAEYQSANAIYPALLFIPYVLLGPLTGYLNDRFAKTRWLLGGNLIKLLGCVVAMLSIALHWENMAWQGLGYFIVGIGACIYGPAKYGILPEILPTERLVKANGTVEMLTLASLLLGALAGARMIDHATPMQCYGALVGIYAVALLLNACMTKTPHNADVRINRAVPEFFRHYRNLLVQPRLGRVLIGTAVFWICGAVMKMNFNPWGLETLGFKTRSDPNTAIALLGLWLAVGIMIGSILAGQLHRVGDVSKTRPYGLLLAVMIGLLGYITNHTVAIAMLIIAGALGGLFLIPLNAALQAESDESKLGKTIACQNFQENVAMCLSSGLVLSGIKAGFTAQAIFVSLAILTGLAALALKIPQAITINKESHREPATTE